MAISGQMIWLGYTYSCPVINPPWAPRKESGRVSSKAVHATRHECLFVTLASRAVCLPPGAYVSKNCWKLPHFVGSHSWRPRPVQRTSNTFATGTRQRRGGSATMLRQAPVRRGFARGPDEQSAHARSVSARGFAEDLSQTASTCLTS